MAMQPEHRQTGLRRPSPTQGKLEQLGIRGLARPWIRCQPAVEGAGSHPALHAVTTPQLGDRSGDFRCHSSEIFAAAIRAFQ